LCQLPIFDLLLIGQAALLALGNQRPQPGVVRGVSAR
jgi:hypothetical protein